MTPRIWTWRTCPFRDRMNTTTAPARFTGFLRLESVDPTRNRARYYELAWQPTLWGTGALVRHWGRMGTAGRTQVLLEADRPRITKAVERLVVRRVRHGYQLTDWG